MSYITGNPGRWKFEPVAYEVSADAMASTFSVSFTNDQGLPDTQEVPLGRVCRLISELEPGTDLAVALRLSVGAVEGEAKTVGISLTQSDIMSLCWQLHEKGLQSFVADGMSEGSIFLPNLYFYDSDTFYDPALGKAYLFFAVCESKIVSEWVMLCDSRSHPKGKCEFFDPAMLTGPFRRPVTLNSHEDDNAVDRYWYGVFYRDTFRGQLMVLRPDKPELYLYPEGRQPTRRELLDAVMSMKLTLFWIGVALTLLVLARFLHF